MIPKQFLLDKEASASYWAFRREERAQILYEAYCNHTNWKSAVTGAPLPAWENVVPAVRGAWIATATAVENTPGW